MHTMDIFKHKLFVDYFPTIYFPGFSEPAYQYFFCGGHCTLWQTVFFKNSHINVSSVPYAVSGTSFH